MEILLLDDNFDVIGPVNKFRTLIWTRRYYEPGIFELHTASKHFQELNKAQYVYRNDRNELGIAEKATLSKGGSSSECSIRGRFAEALLAQRTIVRADITGNCEAVMRRLVQENAISPADSGRIIPKIELGTPTGIGETIRFQTTGQNLSEKLYDIGQTQELSHRLAYDYVGNVLKFEVWKGLDRTDSQDENPWAVFSDTFSNIDNGRYSRDDAEYKNFAYVAGEGEGAARTIIEVDIRDTPDEERREMFVDARDLQKNYNDSGGATHSYTDAEYFEILRQRGLEKLNQHKQLRSISAGLFRGGNLRYPEHFDLGDKVVFRYDAAGVETETRITEINEVFESAEHRINVIFGSGEVESVKQIIRREGA